SAGWPAGGVRGSAGRRGGAGDPRPQLALGGPVAGGGTPRSGGARRSARATRRAAARGARLVVMFSHLRRFTVRDEHGADASLRDLSVDLSAHDYPPVARIIFRHNQRAHLGWEEVRRIELRRRRILVSDFARATRSEERRVGKEGRW